MAINALPIFEPTLKWAGGAGCLVCGANVSELGAKAGHQCIDLGAEDEFLGHFGLCYDCAIQVARVIGYVSQAAAEESLETAAQLIAGAEELEAEAARHAAQARLDKDTIERIVGPYAPAETDVQVA